ncbi:C-Myc-binding family protein [Cardiosporidium cionae]|uniref:c-Myc-binding family protein n=1 Tax=Cardiosporidium cionae TaxID=476202 RepID=A0ABQ7JDV3_9APIC|nr:C-Myc-binding family protein [Cardiosporidium cionae]|eukprot:KAF8822166.1 C-Myc-binding family protein [Cardiosporidium cionae]
MFVKNCKRQLPLSNFTVPKYMHDLLDAKKYASLAVCLRILVHANNLKMDHELQLSDEPATEEFHSYLEEKGVIQRLVKALVGLHEQPQRPDDPLQYLQKQLYTNQKNEDPEHFTDIDELRMRNRELQEKIENLTRELAQKNAQEEEKIAMKTCEFNSAGSNVVDKQNT